MPDPAPVGYRERKGKAESHPGGQGNKQPKKSGHLSTSRVKGKREEEEKSQGLKSQARSRACLPQRESAGGQDSAGNNAVEAAKAARKPRK